VLTVAATSQFILGLFSGMSLQMHLTLSVRQVMEELVSTFSPSRATAVNKQRSRPTVGGHSRVY